MKPPPSPSEKAKTNSKRERLETIGRSLPEWIGATPDTPPPDHVRLRIFRRYGGRCYLTGQKIRAGDAWQAEHILAQGLGGKNRESNLAPVLVEPHKDKTARDVAMISKADRVARKHLGLWPKPKRRLEGRGFDKGRNRAFVEGGR